MRFNTFAVAGLLLSTVAIAAPIDLSTRSDEILDGLVFARDRQSKIYRYVGAAGIPQPRAPTLNSIKPRNQSPTPRTPSPRRARSPSRIPIRKGNNMGKPSEELDDDLLPREPDDHTCLRTCQH